MSVSVVLPAKNESAALGLTIRGIRQVLPDAEVIVVNDGSTDDTVEVAGIAGARVVSHPYSKGNGAAIKTGARAAAGEVIVFMDADGQHDPADIPRLLASLAQSHDMVVGARQKGSQASMGRGLANGLYNRLASWMTGHKVEDLTSGFRAVRADKFREFLYLLPNGFSYPTTSTMAFSCRIFGGVCANSCCQTLGQKPYRLFGVRSRFQPTSSGYSGSDHDFNPPAPANRRR
ncbi:glycosyltransferase family 2 protein [Ottowia beijingensis]|uniref:glycosyltransferase family 2 protein n=1 Tax=Ottowia beijingensis TaxID=1207057 RepID=UPI0028040640|nr:glycosyltransferase family 2 protein [Ottowia beijingensis]